MDKYQRSRCRYSIVDLLHKISLTLMLLFQDLQVLKLLRIEGVPQWYVVQEGDATMLPIAVYLFGQYFFVIQPNNAPCTVVTGKF